MRLHCYWLLYIVYITDNTDPACTWNIGLQNLISLSLSLSKHLAQSSLSSKLNTDPDEDFFSPPSSAPSSPSEPCSPQVSISRCSSCSTAGWSGEGAVVSTKAGPFQCERSQVVIKHLTNEKIEKWQNWISPTEAGDRGTGWAGTTTGRAGQSSFW